MAEMTRERFEALAEAFGGDVCRWPAETQDAASLLMTVEPEFVRSVLSPAQTLDAALDAWRPAPASAALTDRILASAPRPRQRWLQWLSPAALAAGLAAACAAGVIVGVQISERSSAATEQVAASTLSLDPSLDLEEGA